MYKYIATSKQERSDRIVLFRLCVSTRTESNISNITKFNLIIFNNREPDINNYNLSTVIQNFCFTMA